MISLKPAASSVQCVNYDTNKAVEIRRRWVNGRKGMILLVGQPDKEEDFKFTLWPDAVDALAEYLGKHRAIRPAAAGQGGD